MKKSTANKKVTVNLTIGQCKAIHDEIAFAFRQAGTYRAFGAKTNRHYMSVKSRLYEIFNGNGFSDSKKIEVKLTEKQASTARYFLKQAQSWGKLNFQSIKGGKSE